MAEPIKSRLINLLQNKQIRKLLIHRQFCAVHLISFCTDGRLICPLIFPLQFEITAELKTVFNHQSTTSETDKFLVVFSKIN